MNEGREPVHILPLLARHSICSSLSLVEALRVLARASRSWASVLSTTLPQASLELQGDMAGEVARGLIEGMRHLAEKGLLCNVSSVRLCGWADWFDSIIATLPACTSLALGAASRQVNDKANSRSGSRKGQLASLMRILRAHRATVEKIEFDYCGLHGEFEWPVLPNVSRIHVLHCLLSEADVERIIGAPKLQTLLLEHCAMYMHCSSVGGPAPSTCTSFKGVDLILRQSCKKEEMQMTCLILHAVQWSGLQTLEISRLVEDRLVRKSFLFDFSQLRGFLRKEGHDFAVYSRLKYQIRLLRSLGEMWLRYFIEERAYALWQLYCAFLCTCVSSCLSFFVSFCLSFVLSV